MSFSKKLQSLRKANKMSQEKLADLLDVTRQSVSKWESGQTYPEMDKLLAMCKLFKCSLDDLTNDEVTSVKIEEKKKNNLNTFIDSILEFVERTYHMFLQMNKKEIFKCLFVIFCIFIALLICRIPFTVLEDKVYSIISTIHNNSIIHIISGIFNLIVDISYFVLMILVFAYLFKLIYLDHYEGREVVKLESDSVVDMEETKIQNQAEPKQKIVVAKERKEKSYALFDILGKVALFFIKIMTCIFMIPFMISLFCFSAALLIKIVLMFQGVFYFGVLLGLIFFIIFNVLILEFLLNFLLNRKNHVKRMLITFLVSIIGLGLSFGIFMIEFANTKYIDKAPANEKTKIEQKYVTMDDELFISGTGNITYKADNQLTDKLLIEVKYYNRFVKVFFPKEDVAYFSVNSNVLPTQNTYLINQIIDDLSKKQFHNYNKLWNYEVTVYTSESNIQKLEDNYTKNYENEQMEYQKEQEESYQNELNHCQTQISNLEEEKNELFSKNSQYQQEIEQYKAKIQEYKNQMKSLIDE